MDDADRYESFLYCRKSFLFIEFTLANEEELLVTVKTQNI